MDVHRVGLAAKLLAKAQSTPYDPEAMSLVKRSCLILMRVVTDEDTTWLSARTGPAPVRGVGRAERDRRSVEDNDPSSEHHIDLTA